MDTYVVEKVATRRFGICDHCNHKTRTFNFRIVQCENPKIVFNPLQWADYDACSIRCLGNVVHQNVCLQPFNDGHKHARGN